jgi:hypothetical protein
MDSAAVRNLGMNGFDIIEIEEIWKNLFNFKKNTWQDKQEWL